ncbi:TetR/AcrR family transcriptional regulator [Streptomyces zingiberis]|uniref:TetR/AcrR family transcriptional regulator n=1 Tax=Streptomyces zingiberis TaxID=2053010 RepID=A0ABX1BTG0_9ACTN|nr:TetR/AcrR family transcriptional regulator [Streptomyces zingiberis]NJP99695.1 TetR/AcrR family transcriptional regulator [Streptomyces zingiberis]
MTSVARRRMGVEERREQLLAVALEQFGRRSPDEVSLDDIASAAGISRPLLYHYFPGRNGLYEAAANRAAEELKNRFSGPPEGPLRDRLARVTRRWFDFVDTYGPGFASLLRHDGPPGHGRNPVPAGEIRAAALRELLLHLGLDEPGPRLALLLRSWLALAETAALARLDGCGIPRGQLEDQLVRAFTALAAATAPDDEETAGLVRRMAAEEGTDGPTLTAFLTGPRPPHRTADPAAP